MHDIVIAMLSDTTCVMIYLSRSGVIRVSLKRCWSTLQMFSALFRFWPSLKRQYLSQSPHGRALHSTEYSTALALCLSHVQLCETFGLNCEVQAELATASCHTCDLRSASPIEEPRALVCFLSKYLLCFWVSVYHTPRRPGGPQL